jgi:hypothetical protein
MWDHFMISGGPNWYNPGYEVSSVRSLFMRLCLWPGFAESLPFAGPFDDAETGGTAWLHSAESISALNPDSYYQAAGLRNSAGECFAGQEQIRRADGGSASGGGGSENGDAGDAGL